MPQEVFRKIEEVEREAEKTLAKEKERGRRIIEEAEERKEKILARAKQEGEKKGEELKKELSIQTVKEIRETKEGFQRKKEKIEKESKNNLARAVEFILEKAKQS